MDPDRSKDWGNRHTIVQLDSYRMRTTSNFWKILKLPPSNARNEFETGPFEVLEGLDGKTTEEEVVESRIALLACHEMGHALGLDHNFIASTYDRGSVMDYYAPRITFRSDGSVDLSDAYMPGLGSYDRFAIEWGYNLLLTGATKEQEAKRLESIVVRARQQGVLYAGPSDPRWNAYDDRSDPVSWLRTVIPIRQRLLDNYGRNLLRPDEPSSELSSRIAVIYLFHQYALGAALKVIGGAKIPLQWLEMAKYLCKFWPESDQRAALKLELESLEPRELAIPDSLWKFLPPPETNSDDPEAFQSSAGYVFDTADAARAIVGPVIAGLLAPDRLERLQEIRSTDGSSLSASDVISMLVKQAFSVDVTDNAHDERLRNIVRDELLTRLIILAVNDKATAEVQAEAWRGIDEAEKDLESPPPANRYELADYFRYEIRMFKNNPRAEFVPKTRPSVAPPGPPIRCSPSSGSAPKKHIVFVGRNPVRRVGVIYT